MGPTDPDLKPDKSSPGRSNSLLQCRLLGLALVLITLAVFSQVPRGGFMLWDDPVNIVNNPHIRSLDLASLKWMWTDTSYVRRYMPGTWMTYAFTYSLFGLNSHGFHVVSLILHLVNTLLVFAVLRELLRRAVNPARDDSSTALNLCSALGALLWAIHPMRAEVVAWSSAQAYLTATAAALVCVLAYLRANDPARARTRGWYAVSVAAFWVSVLIYPIAIAVLAVLVLLDIFPLRRLSDNPVDWLRTAARRIWWEKIPYAVVMAGMAAATILSRVASTFQGLAAERLVSLEQFSLVSRAMQAFYLLAYYVWKPLIPVGLSPKYPTLIQFDPWSAPFWMSAAGVVAVTVFLLAKRRVFPALAVIWFSHLLLLSPVLGYSEHPHFHYDRYSYVQGICWAAVFTGGAWLASRRPEKRMLVAAVAVALVLAWSALAFQQSLIWRNNVALYTRVVETYAGHPARALQENALGYAWQQQGDWSRAAQWYRRALETDPTQPEANGNLAYLLEQAGQPAAAIPHYQASLRARPDQPELRQNLGVILVSLGRTEEAAAEFREIVRLRPDSPDAHHNLALTLQKLGLAKEAEQHFAEARRLRERR